MLDDNISYLQDEDEDVIIEVNTIFNVLYYVLF